MKNFSSNDPSKTVTQIKMSLQSLYSESKSRKYMPRDVTRGRHPGHDPKENGWEMSTMEK